MGEGIWDTQGGDLGRGSGEGIWDTHGGGGDLGGGDLGHP